MAFRGACGHMNHEGVIPGLAELVGCSSEHFIMALVGGYETKVLNVDAQGMPQLKFKEIGTLYSSEVVRYGGSLGGNTVKMEILSPDESQSPCKSNDVITDGKDSRADGCSDRNNMEDCEELIDLTLKELKTRCKAKRSKVQKSFLSAEADDKDNILIHKSGKGSHAHSQPIEEQSDLDEPLVILKHKLAKKSLGQRKRRKSTCSSLSETSHAEVLNKHDGFSSINSTSVAIACELKTEKEGGMHCQDGIKAEIMDDICSVVSCTSSLNPNFGFPREVLQVSQSFGDEPEIVIPIRMVKRVCGDNRNLSDSVMQNIGTHERRDNLEVDIDNTSLSCVSEPKEYPLHVNCTDLSYNIKKETLEPDSWDQQNAVYVAACPTADFIAKFHFPGEPSVKVPNSVTESAGDKIQLTAGKHYKLSEQISSLSFSSESEPDLLLAESNGQIPIDRGRIIEPESCDTQNEVYSTGSTPDVISTSAFLCELSDGTVQEISNGNFQSIEMISCSGDSFADKVYSQSPCLHVDQENSETANTMDLMEKNNLISSHCLAPGPILENSPQQSAQENSGYAKMDQVVLNNHVSPPSPVAESKSSPSYTGTLESISTAAGFCCQTSATSNGHCILLEETSCVMYDEAIYQKIDSTPVCDDMCIRKDCRYDVCDSNGENEYLRNAVNEAVAVQTNSFSNDISIGCCLLSKDNESGDVSISNIEGTCGSVDDEKYAPNCIKEHPVLGTGSPCSNKTSHQELFVSGNSCSVDENSPKSGKGSLSSGEMPCAAIEREHTCISMVSEYIGNKIPGGTDRLEDCSHKSSFACNDTSSDLHSVGVSSPEEQFIHPLVENCVDASYCNDASVSIAAGAHIGKERLSCWQGTESEQHPKKLLSTRKVLSPTSQEKLCQAVDAEELYESMRLRSRKRLWFEKWTNGIPSVPSHRESDSVLISERVIKKSRNDSFPHTKSILKPPLTPSTKSFSHVESSFISSGSQDAIKFSQRQMHDIEFITTKLVSGLKSMKSIMVETLNSEAFLSVPSDCMDKMRVATENASMLEETAEKYMNMMTRDFKRFCKIMRSKEQKTAIQINIGPKKQKKITFADEAGGLLCHVKVFEEHQDSIVVSGGSNGTDR